MKKIVLIVLGVSFVGIGGYFYSPHERVGIEMDGVGKLNSSSKLVEINQSNQEHNVSQEFPPSRQKSVRATEQDEVIIVVEELKRATQIADIQREKINELIVQFDTNITDLGERKRIKHEMDARMAKYNEAVLPVATGQMKNTSNQ